METKEEFNLKMLIPLREMGEAVSERLNDLHLLENKIFNTISSENFTDDQIKEMTELINEYRKLTDVMEHLSKAMKNLQK